ncbi:low molecular weight phosphatase family protein [Leucobacter sp. wl10]|uniref:arsenate reductase/protein-tyrosine-phosphatase family protein n=1 Tax=Leucobacter sp. wl10 TaxID=2304677 RepID=UPI000E5A5E27|nr:low molecular weight phosphatase family protein [Leucobacter sp. wl10]RGE19799.1 low molecular weight phosphatase family protein [Leucobacter sp. wl10]
MSRRARRRQAPVAVLTVCTGNICRSPLAEQLLRSRFADDPRFEFGSAGLEAVAGAPMDPAAARQLVALGGDPAGLIGEQIGERHADAADLILTMTRSQRDEVVRRFPRSVRRVFTLAEFSALLDLDESQAATADPRALIEEASRRRSEVRLGEADDVVDPIDAADEVHARVASQVAGYVDAIAAGLGRS